ncbi:MAG: DUF2101 family protein [Methanobacteriaceae archaeon]|nr:DUF2101 family protein [Methanobacteriaceae archaeon]
MKIFSKFGDIIITLFSFTGAIVIGIIRLPTTIRELDLRKTGPEKIKETVQKIDTDEIGEKVSKITNKVDEKYSDYSNKSSKKDAVADETLSPIYAKELGSAPDIVMESDDSDLDEGSIIIKSSKFDSKEKENTVLRLQIASGAFLVASVLLVFHFIAFYIYVLLGILLSAFIYYTVYYKIKLMYPQDFKAYRDFFFLYVVVGIVLVFVGGNANITMAFPFQFFPSFSLLIFAVISVAAVFLLFRIRYHRNYTYGEIIEAGMNTSHVKVDYDIRSNVKPDMYIVENNGFNVSENEMVKLEIDGSIFNMKGNRPFKVIGKVERFN